ncbi:MAG: 50S ribosomal protein L29 [Clostridia bacterium]|jgi:large subunit ribosomal protein L29|nr:50S ribosomal protein L29 [Clostridiaceae bacterium]
MKANELREMTMGELNEELRELKSELFKLRFQHATSRLANPMQIKAVKKDIARIKTIIRQREIEGMKAQ